jgi:hypothetical protein
MKFSNTRLLGIIGIIGAPWMFIDFINNGFYEHFEVSAASGVRNFLFMTGWICSLLGLYKLRALGDKIWQKMIFILQMLFLLLAEVWSVMEMTKAGRTSRFFFTLNYSWHVAGFLMILTGIQILRKNQLKGWKRFVPLLAGFWFPGTLCIYFFTGNSIAMVLLSGVYSMIVFSLLGFTVATHGKVGSPPPQRSHNVH